MRRVELFGGAMQCDMPTSLCDVSALRQVPDHQEVYVDNNTGATLIVELLSRQGHVADADAAAFFFADLAKDNGCSTTQSRITSSAPLLLSSQLPCLLLPSPSSSAEAAAQQPAMRGDVYAHRVTGVQYVSKYANEVGKENEVWVGLVVVRLPPPVSTDMLVTLSAPAQLHPDSSDAHVVRQLLTAKQRDDLLAGVLATLQVNDWRLFVLEDD